MAKLTRADEKLTGAGGVENNNPEGQNTEGFRPEDFANRFLSFSRRIINRRASFGRGETR
jgi:hypothetical protein